MSYVIVITFDIWESLYYELVSHAPVDNVDFDLQVCLFVCFVPTGQYPDVRLAIAGLFLDTDCTIVLGTWQVLLLEVNYPTCCL